MFSKGYNEVRAEIEVHYDILKQMIGNISTL